MSDDQPLLAVIEGGVQTFVGTLAGEEVNVIHLDWDEVLSPDRADALDYTRSRIEQLWPYRYVPHVRRILSNLIAYAKECECPWT